MTLNIRLSITPSAETAAALAKAHKDQQNAGSTDSNPARRIKYEWLIPGTNSTLEIVRVEADAKNQSAVYNCSGNPADYLIGSHGLSGNSLIETLVPVQLALYKAAMLAWLPDLTDEILESITHANCKLDSLTLGYYYEYESPTEAYRSWLNWYQHAKVVFDSASRMPTRSNSWRKYPVRVTADTDCRDAFTVTLPFGQARVALKRDLDSYPSAKPSVQSLDERKAMLAQLRSLLTVEVAVDLSKFYYTDNSGLDLQLPRDYQLWNPGSMPEGPVAIIWNRFCWESWLQADLLNEADGLDPEDFKPHLPLTWEMQEVAKAYFSGEFLQRHPQIDGNPKKFEKYREALIARAGIDILNPWGIAQLNLGKELKRDFALANRFLPQQHEGFVPHTLAKQTVGAAIRKLDASMQDKPGWSFDASAYEDTDE